MKIEWKYYHGGGAVINQAQADKELDFAFLGDFAATYGEANGNNTRLLASGPAVNIIWQLQKIRAGRNLTMSGAKKLPLRREPILRFLSISPRKIRPKAE